MSSLTRVIWAREMSSIYFSRTFYVGLGIYFALTAGLFFTALQMSEGSFWTLQALWTLSTAIPLPLLITLITMPLFAGEHATGTLPLLLLLPIPMRRLVTGKFWAAYLSVLLAIAGSLIPWFFLSHNLSGKLPPVTALLPAFLLLALQAMSWTALGVSTSAMASRPWVAGMGTILLAGGVMLGWASLSRLFLGTHTYAASFPLIAQQLDAAAGRIELHTVVMHVSFSIWCLFIGIHYLEARR